MAPRGKKHVSDGVELLAPSEDVTSVGCAAGTFEVVDGKVTVPEEAVADLASAGFTLADGTAAAGWAPPDATETTETVEETPESDEQSPEKEQPKVDEEG